MKVLVVLVVMVVVAFVFELFFECVASSYWNVTATCQIIESSGIQKYLDMIVVEAETEMETEVVIENPVV